MRKSKKKWNIISISNEDIIKANELSQILEIPRIAATALLNRGYRDAKQALEYIRNEKVLLHEPFLLPNMERACEIIIDAIDKCVRICVYGDYDVDGISATALFYKYLKSKNANVTYYIPDRKTEGYGMNMSSVRKIHEDGTELIITVDNGITAVDEIAYAKELGMSVVVTDHHSCHDTLPDADASVNPKIPGSQYPFSELAGVGVAFKTVCAIETLFCKKEGRDVKEAARELCMKYTDLVTIGTVADVMPLRDENRLLCTMGLYILDNRPSEGLNALMYMASLGDTVSASAEYYMNRPREVKKRKLNASYIGFVLAPRLNAAGRVTHANDALSLLLAEGKKEAAEAAYNLCAINNQRKNIETAIFNQALEMIERENEDTDDEKIIVLSSDEWKHGVVGIVASRLLELYGLPVILVSFEDGITDDEPSPLDEGKGSCRSIKGFDIHAALDYCSDLFVKYGGHELAAGLTVTRENFDEFKERVSKYARENMKDESEGISIDIDCEAFFPELTLDCAKTISAFEPYGSGNPQPIFASRNVLVKRINSLSQGKYSKILLEKDGCELSGLCFFSSPEALPVYEGEYADIAFTLDVNEFRGVSSVQLTLEDIKFSDEFEKECKEKSELLEKFALGEDVSFCGEKCPERKEFAAFYNYIRRQNSEGFFTVSLRKAVFTLKEEQGINLDALASELIMLVFSELSLIICEKITPDIYSVSLPAESRRADLSSSTLLQRFKKACGE